MKVEDAVRDALAEIGQQAVEQPVQPVQMTNAIRYLNRFMAAFSYLNLGYVAVDSASDTITVPAEAEEWVVLKLATKLAAQYSSREQIDITKSDEREAYNNLLIKCQFIDDLEYPNTLPIGSGNEYSGSNVFFNEENLSDDV